jgi:hypothetical protein
LPAQQGEPADEGPGILKAVLAPNPFSGRGGLVLRMAGNADSLEIKAYSSGWTLAGSWQLAPGLRRGWNPVVPLALDGLANGYYTLRATAKANNKAGNTVLLRVLILR